MNDLEAPSMSLTNRPLGAGFDDVVIVIGGSNSVMREGWYRWFRIYARDRMDLQVINFSIGAASSLMSVYRILADDIRGRNVTIVWEYAINEDVCVRHRDDIYSPTLVGRNVRRFLTLCARRNIKVLPLLLPTQRMWKNEDWHLTKVIETEFKRFGTKPFRYDRLLARRIADLADTPVFLDTLHFAPGPISKMIASSVLKRMHHAEVPVIPEDEPANSLTWFVTADFQPGEPIRFRNRLFDTHGYRPAEGNMLHPAPTSPSSLLGIIYVSQIASHGFEMRLPDESLHLASAPLASKISVQLKIFPLEAVRDRPIRLHPGETLGFRYSLGSELLAPATFNPTPGTPEVPAAPLSTIAGLLWETEAATE